MQHLCLHSRHHGKCSPLYIVSFGPLTPSNASATLRPPMSRLAVMLSASHAVPSGIYSCLLALSALPLSLPSRLPRMCHCSVDVHHTGLCPNFATSSHLLSTPYPHYRPFHRPPALLLRAFGLIGQPASVNHYGLHSEITRGREQAQAASSV